VRSTLVTFGVFALVPGVALLIRYRLYGTGPTGTGIYHLI
jgi:hypothetical protein